VTPENLLPTAPPAELPGESPGETMEELFQARPPPPINPPDPAETDLARELVPAVLWRAHLQRVTGVMVFASGPDSREVFFEEGVPVSVRSTLSGDHLEEMLLRRGLVDRAAYAEARVRGLDQPRSLAAHLVERGVLRPEELFPVVRRHLEECLHALFEWKEGTVRFSPGHVPDAEKVRLARPMAALIMEGIRRKFLLPRLQQAIGGPSSLVAPVSVERRSGIFPDPSAFGFQPAEREIFRLVNGLRPIEEMVFLTGQEAAAVYRVVLAGLVTGLLVVTVKGLRGGGEDAEDSQERRLEIARRRVLGKHELLNKSNYFEILGVSAESTPYEIEEAFRTLQREFHPMHFAHPLLQELLPKLELIRRTIEEAFEVLSDDFLRESYRKSLADARRS